MEKSLEFKKRLGLGWDNNLYLILIDYLLERKIHNLEELKNLIRNELKSLSLVIYPKYGNRKQYWENIKLFIEQNLETIRKDTLKLKNNENVVAPLLANWLTYKQELVDILINTESIKDSVNKWLISDILLPLEVRKIILSKVYDYSNHAYEKWMMKKLNNSLKHNKMEIQKEMEYFVNNILDSNSNSIQQDSVKETALNSAKQKMSNESSEKLNSKNAAALDINYYKPDLIDSPEIAHNKSVNDLSVGQQLCEKVKNVNSSSKTKKVLNNFTSDRYLLKKTVDLCTADDIATSIIVDLFHLKLKTHKINQNILINLVNREDFCKKIDEELHKYLKQNSEKNTSDILINIVKTHLPDIHISQFKLKRQIISYLRLLNPKSGFKIQKCNRFSKENNQGAKICATKFWKKKSILHHLNGYTVNLKSHEIEKLGKDNLNFSLTYSNRNKKTQLWLGPGAYVNHSCKPNAKYCSLKSSGEICLQAIRDIHEGEEICSDYGHTYFDTNECECLHCKKD